MKINRLFIIAFFAVALIAAVGIPTKPQIQVQNGPAEVFMAGRNVNMVSGTTLPDGDPYLQRQNEPSLAVSSRNALHLLAGANDYRTVDMPIVDEELPGIEEMMAADAWLGYYTSDDGGESWKTALLPGFPQDTGSTSPLRAYTTAADPWVCAGSEGRFYYSGLAFNRGDKNSAIFVARFEDTNDKETCGNTVYRGNTIVVTGNSGQFVDMPRMAVDVPRGTGNDYVFLVYTTFLGNLEQNVKSKMYCTRSTDGGLTWSSPTKLSESQHVIQGANIGIDPLNGDVYVAFRRFYHKSQENGIVVVKSSDRGQTFSSPIEIATFPTDAFDQPATPNELLYPDPNDYVPGESIRTNSYPTIAVDDNHRVFVAWSQRNMGPAGAARIVMKTSLGGSTWGPLMDINPPGSVHQGHEFMPQWAFGAGKMTLVWYDQRFDQTAHDHGFEHWIGDWLTNIFGDVLRHTIDVWAAQFNATDYADPTQWSYTQVSRYLHSLLVDQNGDVIIYNGYPYIYPVQFNCLNYPMFKDGTLPFMGDYIALAASPTIILNDSGNWVFNTEYSDNPVFHAAWTDNRDVRPPAGLFDWTDYTPADSVQDPDYISPGRSSCSAGGNRPAIRNQNIYTAKLSWGIIAGSPANEKSLDLSVPRAFVVFVQNNTDLPRRVRMTISEKPVNGTASFLQFDDSIDQIFVTIVPFSTVSRQVFMQSTDPNDSARIDIVEVDAGGDDITGGLTGFVIINGDPSNDGVSGEEEHHQPQFSNPNIVNWVVNPNIVNPNIVNPNIVNPNIVNPNIVNPNIVNPNIVNEPINPNIVNPNIVNPNIVNPNIVNPNIVNPNIVNPNIVNPNIVNPNIVNPNIVNTSLPGGAADVPVFDVMWTVTNEGNTATTYTLDTVAKKAPPEGIYTQLLIYRVHKTPSIAGSVLSSSSPDYDECTLYEEPHHELILNILNPNIVNPNIVNLGSVNPNIVNPNIVNESINNATFALGPGEEAVIDLRVLDTEDTATSGNLITTQDEFSIQAFNVNEFISSIGFVVTSMAVDSDDAFAGITTPKGAATDLYIVSSNPPDGVVGLEYNLFSTATMTAFGGTAPYNYTWSLNSGLLPPGMSISTGTTPDPQAEGGPGIISGIPTEAGTYVFMVQVTDDNDPLHVDTQLFSLTTHTGSIPDTPIITTTSLPSGVKGTWYGATIHVAGGDPPFTFSWSAQGTPTPEADGLMLDPTNGIITGTPAVATPYNFDVTVTDSDSVPDSATVNLDLDILASTGSYFVISGTVYDGVGGPLDGVHLYGLPNSPTTDSYGYYEDYVPEGWSGTVIPFKLNHFFTPDSRVYDQVQADQFGQDYNQQEWAATQSDVVRVTDMVVDSFGNAYVSGVGNTGAYVAKYDNTGTFQWHFRYGSTAEDLFYGLCVDPDGYVYATGDVNQNILTVKYDPDGNFEWSDEYDSGYDDDEGLDIAIDALGNFYVSGSVGTATPDIPDACTIKYEQSGGTITRKWMNIYDDGDHDYGLKIAIDPEGKIVVAGYNASPPYVTHDDYFIIKYDTYGTEEWSLRYDGGISQDYLHDLCVDAAGNVYVTGRKETVSGADYLTAKFNSFGTFQWKAEYDGANHYDDWANAITVDAYGYVYVTGRSGEYLCADPYVCDDYATIKYDPSGNAVWTPGGDIDANGAARYDGPPGFDHDVAQDIEVDPLGNVYVTGKSVGNDGSFDFATLIYDSVGAKIWEARYGIDSRNDEAGEIELDPEGNIFVSGPSGDELLVLKYSQSFPTTLSITTEALPNGIVGLSYNAVLEAFGGTGVYDWSISGGSLPTGLNIDGPTGIIFGTPSTAGTTNFTIEVTDGALTDSKPMSITIVEILTYTLSVDVDPFPSGEVTKNPDKSNYVVGESVEITAAAYAGWAFDEWSGDVPAGQENDNPLTLVMDANKVLTANFLATLPPIITTESIPDGVQNEAYGPIDIEVIGGTPPLSWDVVGSLPDGLNLVDGEITGTPTESGYFTFTIQVDDPIFPPQSQDLSMTIAEWVATYNGPGSDIDNAWAAVGDHSGNVYVTGHSVGTTWPDYDYVTIKYNSAGAEEWVARYAGSGGDLDRAEAIAVDSWGNVYVTGHSTGATTGKDFVTIKYNNSGAQQWVAPYDGPGGGDDVAVDIAVDSSGNVYVTGKSHLNGTTNKDYTTIKYDSSGNEVWVTRDDLSGNHDYAEALAIDTSGNVYVTGRNYDADYATVKYNNDGVQEWVTTYDGTGGGFDRAKDIVVDTSGNVYVTGESTGSGTLYDFATVKYDDLGNELWSERYNSPDDDYEWPHDISIDSAGNVYVTGTSQRDATFNDYLTIKYDSAGDELWVSSYNGPYGDAADEGTALVVNPLGNVYVTGYSRGVGTGSDIGLIKYDSEGNELWVARYNGPDNSTDDSGSIVLDPFGNIISSGGSAYDTTGKDCATVKYSQSFPSTLVITTESLDNATVGVGYAATVWAFGGSDSREWSNSGALPPGLGLNISTGVISGIPSALGTYNFVITVQDGANINTRSLSITVQAPIILISGQVVDDGLGIPDVQILETNSYTYIGETDSNGFYSVGVFSPYTGSIKPEKFDPETIHFWPIEIPYVDIAIAQSNQDFQRHTVSAPLTISGPTSGIVGEAYSFNTGGSNCNIHGTNVRYWIDWDDGSWSGWVTASAQHTWSVPGTYTVKSRAICAEFLVPPNYIDFYSDWSAETVIVTISAAGPPPLEITTTSLPDGVENQAYFAALVATGGTPPYIWDVSGNFPSGLNLNQNTGVISGEPAVSSGLYTFTVHVQDSTLPSALTDSQELSIQINEQVTGKIVFHTIRDGNWEIYMINADGTGLENLTNHSNADITAAISPDGSKIAFSSYRDKTLGSELYVMNSDGYGLSRKTFTAEEDYNESPSWSPDGNKIAFTSERNDNFDIYVINADGTGETRLTTDAAIDGHPSWSPDGSQIAFYSNRDGNSEIYKMNSSGTGQTRLTSDSGSGAELLDNNPAWSPDGTKIAFATARHGDHEIYTMNTDGGDQTRITVGPGSSRNPCWSPDGYSLTFMRFQPPPDLNDDICIMRIDGTGFARLTTNTANDFSPNWGISETHTISGKAIRDVFGVVGVEMIGLPGTPITDTEGNYSATVLDGWSGTVVPYGGDWYFNPPYTRFSNVTANTSQFYVAEQHARIKFISHPSDTQTSMNINPPIQVLVLDADGLLPLNNELVTITIGANPTGGSLSGTNVLYTGPDGKATFDDLSIDTPGIGYTLLATAAGYSPNSSLPFSIFDLTPQSASRFDKQGFQEDNSINDIKPNFCYPFLSEERYLFAQTILKLNVQLACSH